MKKIFTFFVFLALVVFKGYSQTARQVHGIIADSTGITVPGAVVKLTSTTDSLNVVTDINGVFTFGSVKAKKFSLTILSIGFQGLKRNYTFDDDSKPANIGMIKLKAESKLLGVVNITDVNAVKVSIDTTEYKASAYPVRANAPVEDVLKKLPGVDVDKDGNITAEGKSVTKVRINGKDFFGGDVKTATKNLPADVIESIQMIDDYGDQANLTGLKTGEPNKIMNIVIRKDKNYGYSVSATGGDGVDALPSKPGVVNDNRYMGALNSFKFRGDQQIALLGSINNTNINTFSFTGGGGGGGGGRAARLAGGGNTPSNGITDAKSIGLNFRDQWGPNLSVYGSYSFADNSVYTVNTSIQKSIDGSFINNSNGKNTDGTLNHRVTWNMEWKPDTVNYFKFTPTFAYSSTTADDFSQNSILTNNVQGLLYNSKTTGNSNSPNYGGTLLYNHHFPSRRNFSLNLTANTGPTDQFSNPITTYIVGRPNGGLSVPANQLINTHTATNTEGINASYIEPLSKVSFLEANYTFSRSATNTSRINDTVTVAGQQNYYDLLSNNYNSTFTTNRFGLNYRLIETKYNLTLGAAAQPGVLEGFSPATTTYPSVVTNVNTFNFIPTARFVYNFSRSQAFSVNYNGSSSQPSYSQLNPRPDKSDPTYIVTGNPNLSPEFNNNFSIRYNKFSFGTGNILFTNLSFTQTNNKVVTNVNTNGSTQSVDYRNADGYYSANGFVTFAKPWSQRKYTLILNGNVNYTNNIGFSNDIKNIAKQLTYTPGARFRLDITDVVDAQASVNYAVTTTNNTNSSLDHTYQTTTLGLSGKNYFWTDWTLNYDYSKAINEGYSGAVTNPNILNAYVERRFLKNNMATIRASVYDIFNQNTGYTNTSTGNYITESTVNRLGRYFLMTLTIRLQQFAGKTPDDFPGGKRRGFGGGGPGGGGPGGGGGGFGGPGQ